MLVYNMAEVNEIRETEHTSNQIRSFPRDLLQRFISGNRFPRKFEETMHDEEGNIELSLGLSLNGHFGVDPQRAKNLIRSSSISNFLSTDESTACSSHAPLVRTCSLPTETEEEWRKRKELQSLRRMVAKRKRVEKLKNARVVREKIDLEENWEENGGELVGVINGKGEVLRAFGDDGIELKAERSGGLGGGVGFEGLQPPPQFSSQGSIGSQGSGSSGVSDFQSQPIRGTNRCTEVRSPASVQSLPEQIEQKLVTPEAANDDPGKLAGGAVENPSTQVAVVDDKEAKERVRNMMVDMPCVSTRGDGPNGKRIEGFLYRYRKGEEVRIVCLCHGSFLSPAEFVRHAGGGDVAHPLRHIIVNPSPFL